MNLLAMYWSYNMLSGTITAKVINIANLASHFNVSKNLLHGPILLELRKMTMVQAIDISANQLTSYIPTRLKSCKEL